MRDRVTKKDKLRLALKDLGVKFFAKDNTVTLQERMNAHKEKRAFVEPPKADNPFKKKTTKKGSTVSKRSTPLVVQPTVKLFKHAQGNYRFKGGRTHVILKGTKYTTVDALRNADIMNELIERNHSGLKKV